MDTSLPLGASSGGLVDRNHLATVPPQRCEPSAPDMSKSLGICTLGVLVGGFAWLGNSCNVVIGLLAPVHILGFL